MVDQVWRCAYDDAPNSLNRGNWEFNDNLPKKIAMVLIDASVGGDETDYNSLTMFGCENLWVPLVDVAK